MNSFADLGINNDIVRAMKKMGWTDPTPVQMTTIPVGLEGKDLFAQAQTGTGKTGTYGSIILSRVGSGYKTPSALVLVPTRELALQVSEELGKLSAYTGHTCLAIYGGASIEKQIGNLKTGVDIAVGTPGRVKDLLSKQALKVQKTSMLVLDEADRMLDMGFAKDLNEIISKLPKKRQTMLFSATMPKEVEQLAMSKMTNPEKLLVSKDEIVLDLIEQRYMVMNRDNKKDTLCTMLDNGDPKTIVFCQTRRRANQLGKKMFADNYNCAAIHGDVTQNKREKIIEDFKNGKLKILIATDVAARGLDINDVDLVVNYDLTDPETYVHRIGRTGRAGKKGLAVTFIEDGELRDIQRIARVNGKPIDEMTIDIVAKADPNIPRRFPDGPVRTPGRDEKKTAKKTEKRSQQAQKRKMANEDRVMIMINLGNQDGIKKKDLCDLIQIGANVGPGNLGVIDLRETVSFVDVRQNDAKVIAKSLCKYDRNGKKLFVKINP